MLTIVHYLVNSNSKTNDLKRLTAIALFAALTAVFSKIFIPLPFTPIPVTLQVLGVLVAGLVLGPKEGFLSQLLYLLIGILGIPVFSKGGGLAYLLGPTGGFLWSFPVAAFITGYLSRRKTGSVFMAALGGVLALAIIYLMGTFQLSLLMKKGFITAIEFAVLPFIPADLFKLLISLTIYKLFSYRNGLI